MLNSRITAHLWFSAEKKLPRDMLRVLVFYLRESGQVCVDIGVYVHECGMWHMDGFLFVEKKSVLYWTHLPSFSDLNLPSPDENPETQTRSSKKQSFCCSVLSVFGCLLKKM